MKLLIMQFSPTSCHFITLRSKYSPQQPVLLTPSDYVSFLISETKFHTSTEPQADILIFSYILEAFSASNFMTKLSIEGNTEYLCTEGSTRTGEGEE
jgi:uncharacterized membrane protein (DUF106 family)